MANEAKLKPIQHTYEPPTRPLDDLYTTYYRRTCVNGGYNPDTKQFVPFTTKTVSMDDEAVSRASMHLAAGLEAGVFTEEKWPAEAFETEQAYIRYAEMLADLEDEFKLVDTWYQALMVLLTGRTEEAEGYNNAAQLPERLLERLEEFDESPWAK